jgi:hypothetical protein
MRQRVRIFWQGANLHLSRWVSSCTELTDSPPLRIVAGREVTERLSRIPFPSFRRHHASLGAITKLIDDTVKGRPNGTEQRSE